MAPPSKAMEVAALRVMQGKCSVLLLFTSASAPPVLLACNHNDTVPAWPAIPDSDT